MRRTDTRRRGWVTWLVLVTFTTACAGARVENVQRFDVDRPLAKPPLLVLYDFAVSEHDVVVDAFGPSGVSGPGETSERNAKAKAMAAAFAQLAVDKLGERGIAAARASETPVPPVNALVVKGQFLSISEGDQMKRVLIGFGAGATEIRVRVQTYQWTGEGLHQISQGESLAHGSKKPGMALPVIGGAIWGSVLLSAAISGGLAVTSETFGGLDADMKRLVDLLVGRAETFYQQQGWL